jgi:putative membrane protein
MYLELTLRYLHFVSIFLVVSAVVTEYFVLKPQMSRAELQRIAGIDGIYGLASIAVVGVGLYLWLGGVGKPAEFYTDNPIFLTKVALFVVVGLLSIYPTVFFLKNRKGDDREELVTIPNLIKTLIKLELLLLFLMPLLATFMARGVRF